MGRTSGRGVLTNRRSSLVQQAESALQVALRLAEPSLGNVPAVTPYRQLPLLAQFLASQQVLPQRRPSRPVQGPAHRAPDTDRPCPAGRGSPWSMTTCSTRVTESDRLTEPTQRRPEVGQNARGADRVGDVADGEQPAAVVGEDPVGGLQVAACPVRHPHERDRLAAPEVLSFGQELEDPLSVSSRYRAHRRATEHGRHAPRRSSPAESEAVLRPR